MNNKKKSDELANANNELAFRKAEKEKRDAELKIANKELAFQNDEKEKRASELEIANKELIYQNSEKEKRAVELTIANKELAFQNSEKEKRAAELIVANYARGLIEASRDPLFTIGRNGKITDLNHAAIRAIGQSREILIDSDFLNYFTEPEKAREGYQLVFEKGFVVDYPLTIKDNALTDVLFNGSVYKDEKGNIIGAVVVARDITEQKRIEKELTEAKVFAELATAIAEEAQSKAESAALMAEEAQNKAEKATLIAEDAVKAKQQFLSNMSHEIRTPMNAIIGFTKVLHKTELTEKQKEYLSAIKISGDALIVLIDDILDLAKVDTGKMTFEQAPFKMSLSLSAMLQMFETKVQEKNLVLVREYDSRIPEVLIGDSARLHQIILNLLSNAVKFTIKGRIALKATVVKESEETITIEFAVMDTGIGIPENKIDQIFENFQRATSSTSRLYGGTGLGLAIVKQLVEAQGGLIKVTSKINEGSAFSFILSFNKANEETIIETELTELDNRIKNIKVLVVEDIPLNQLLMKTILEDFGFEQDIAANGKIAIEKLKTNKYNIILMDLQMPEMNGFEATEYIRNKMNSKIPIIALTADVTTVDLAKCKAAGMNDYIAKPVDEGLLRSKIINLAGNSSMKIKELSLNTTDLSNNRCTNLERLRRIAKSNPKLMMEVISLYLEQTPALVNSMNKGFKEKDLKMLHTAVHTIIPSFSIVGISKDHENTAKKIQEYAIGNQSIEGIENLVKELTQICNQACAELKEEHDNLKTM